jgi:hypothetical protein
MSDQRPGAIPRRLVVAAGALLGVALLGWFVLSLLGGEGDRGSRPARVAAPSTSPAVAFGDCKGCHADPDAIFMRADKKGLNFRHAIHFEKATSDCAACHVAKPHTGTGTVKPGHERCFACHGTGTATIVRTGTVIAPGSCTTCHKVGTIPKPATHATGRWLSGQHGAQALAASTKNTCASCHTTQSCTSCHGVTMPHPKGFTGATHVSTVNKVGAAVCQRCHGGGSSARISGARAGTSCESCHHPMKPAGQSMVSFHQEYIEHRSTAQCARCHTIATFCTRCHGSEGDDD